MLVTEYHETAWPQRPPWVHHILQFSQQTSLTLHLEFSSSGSELYKNPHLQLYEIFTKIQESLNLAVQINVT